MSKDNKINTNKASITADDIIEFQNRLESFFCPKCMKFRINKDDAHCRKCGAKYIEVAQWEKVIACPGDKDVSPACASSKSHVPCNMIFGDVIGLNDAHCCNCGWKFTPELRKEAEDGIRLVLSIT